MKAEFSQFSILAIAATITALASRFVSPSVDAESDPNFSCSLKLRDVKTEAG